MGRFSDTKDSLRRALGSWAFILERWKFMFAETLYTTNHSNLTHSIPKLQKPAGLKVQLSVKSLARHAKTWGLIYSTVKKKLNMIKTPSPSWNTPCSGGVEQPDPSVP